jgi:hypothetical protein
MRTANRVYYLALNQAWDQAAWSPVGFHVGPRVRGQVYDQVQIQVQTQVKIQVENQVWRQVRSQTWEKIDESS